MLNVKTKPFTMSDLFTFKRGRVISKLYIQDHPGEYPLYSSAIGNNGIIGYIDSYDCDGLYITWGTDNEYFPRVRNGKFTCTNVCGFMKPKDYRWTERALQYVCGASRCFAKYFDWSNKASSTGISALSVTLPVRTVIKPDFALMAEIGGGC